MNRAEAQFILSSYRPNGGDALDSLFADALAQARIDPGLREWFADQLKFDTGVSAKLRECRPPAELRATLAVGCRLSRTCEARRRSRLVLYACAALFLLIGLSMMLWRALVH